MGLCSRLCKSHHSHPLEFCTRCRLCISMQPIHAYIIHTARRSEVHRPRPFNRGFQISLQQLCLSSVHLMSCQLDDIGCTKDEHNFGTLTYRVELWGCMFPVWDLQQSLLIPAVSFAMPLATWPTTKVAEIAPRAIKVLWY